MGLHSIFEARGDVSTLTEVHQSECSRVGGIGRSTYTVDMGHVLGSRVYVPLCRLILVDIFCRGGVLGMVTRWLTVSRQL